MQELTNQHLQTHAESPAGSEPSGISSLSLQNKDERVFVLQLCRIDAGPFSDAGPIADLDTPNDVEVQGWQLSDEAKADMLALFKKLWPECYTAEITGCDP